MVMSKTLNLVIVKEWHAPGTLLFIRFAHATYT